jgi:hypothetical protein
MTPSVTPCVWLTPRPRRSKWWALRAGPVVMRARRASLPSAERVAGGIAGGMFSGCAGLVGASGGDQEGNESMGEGV